MLKITILLLGLFWCLGLWIEGRDAAKSRATLRHVVHVNGTRGKSTICRLIEAGLRAGGLRVFCKTTGTDPMTIDVSGNEEPLRRRGKANIKEQVGILRRAAAQNAEVLVIECMALQPEYQRCAQHRILQADVGVITNVRHDHADVMGDSLPEIADTLSNTIPKGGVLFTADEAMAARLRSHAEVLGSRFVLARPAGDEPDFDFAENISLALAVCEDLGVSRETALAGMAHYKCDPYALALYKMGQGIFVNAVSVNDSDSTCIVWEDLQKKLGEKAGKLILIVCNRADRGSRTRDMLTVCERLAPAEIWLAGSHKDYMTAKLHRFLPDCAVRSFSQAGDMPLNDTAPGTVLFAVGNLYGAGRKLIARVREEGEPYV